MENDLNIFRLSYFLGNENKELNIEPLEELDVN